MESNYPNPSTRTPMYPQLNPQSSAPFSNPEPSAPLYPTVDFSDLYDNNTNTNPFPDQTTFHFNQIPPSATTLHFNQIPPSAPVEESSKTSEESLLTIPNTILNLIDKNYSIELASGNFQILRLLQQTNTLAVLATVADDIQFPLTKDIAAVKLDSSHYFFSFNPPSNIDSIENDKKSKKNKKKNNKEKIKEENEQVLSYGLTILGHSEEGENLLDWVLDSYCNFSVREVKENAVIGKDVAASLGELERQDVGKNKKKDVVEGKCAAYWTTLAPNVEDYSGSAARLIASGSGQLVKGILWCGDVTGERLNWGEEVLKKRMAPGGKDAVVDPSTLKRIKRVKRVSKMTHKVANGLLSGAVKVSGYLTGSIANSKAGKKFFSMLPGEILLASLDGFSKICDAAEVSGKHVMSTSSTVTTGLVTHKYGDEAGKATSEGLDAAGNAIGTAWTVFKIRQALNPKSVLKPTTLAKTAAKSALSEKKAKK